MCGVLELFVDDVNELEKAAELAWGNMRIFKSGVGLGVLPELPSAEHQRR